MKIIGFISLLGLSAPAWAQDDTKVDIAVVKAATGDWTVTYQTQQPVSRLGFVRNPDHSRTTRWTPQSSEFDLVLADNKEYLVRIDGTDFTKASVTLTPTYKHLSKDYAPFSPYSDGGTLIYTGRLFACADTCSEENQQWRVSMQVPAGEHIILAGKVHTGSTSWIDSGDGMNVYVGAQPPIETPNVIAVIDPGLPEKIKHALEADIPALMTYFEKKLGPVEGEKPTLFASYANVEGHSSQGGTLPNQIFMHWNVNNLEEKVATSKFLNDTLWFFAHEVAHLYQRSGKGDNIVERQASWLHEGHAEWSAALALSALYPDTNLYVSNKTDRFKEHCATGLTDFPLAEAAERGRFDLYYTCGLVIHQAIDSALRTKSDRDSYSLWNAFRERVETSDEQASDVFLTLVAQWVSEELAANVKIVVEQQQSDPREAIQQLSLSAN
ncbi:hypothetical protein OCL06_08835 [Alteromonas sp. ASW11-19]|uniref:Peptidase M61 catalytic domain-containing protein n=1 Tax=Alteromonas salexigens TaxID=2982530 RepID=A0ABT2VP93_9ALTE|nr:hypothetical protein [Alteromonas salexigens]MCU7554702.1 hypothetical protein [Alteromonas salexigens]